MRLCAIQVDICICIQHGFRKGGSCVSNLLEFLDYVTKNLDNRNSVDVIYLDFAKAFDKVPHCRLLEKINKHGISGKVLEWLKEWLHGRKQRVCINGHFSSWTAVTSGVPQGSVLGPVLFLIYINDIDSNLLCAISKFADDTKLSNTVNCNKDRDQLQLDLQHLVEWSTKWQMPFNDTKCSVMHLGGNNQKFDYFMGSHKLEAVSQERDLGVWITDNLKPSMQCQYAYSKASRALGLIGRTITYKSEDVLIRLYKTLVRPHLEYCVSAWSPYYVKDRLLLERVQHRFTRMVPGLRNLSYENRLDHLGLWALEERRNRADLLEIFKMYKGFSTIPFERLFEFSTATNTRGHSAKIAKHHCHLDLRRYFFSERTVDRWNSLSQQDINCSTVNSFKNCLIRIRHTKMGFFMD